MWSSQDRARHGLGLVNGTLSPSVTQGCAHVWPMEERSGVVGHGSVSSFLSLSWALYFKASLLSALPRSWHGQMGWGGLSLHRCHPLLPLKGQDGIQLGPRGKQAQTHVNEGIDQQCKEFQVNYKPSAAEAGTGESGCRSLHAQPFCRGWG